MLWSDFKRRIATQPGFWLFQIGGWILFSIGMKLYFPSTRVVDAESFIVFYKFYFIGFLLTLILRQFYKRIFLNRRSILTILPSVLIFPAIMMIPWSILNGLANYFFWSDTERLAFIETWLTFKPGDFYHKHVFWYLILLLWSTLYFSIKFWNELVLEKQRAKESELLAVTSQLRMLRYQLNPHFLFNSLTSIQALIYEDPVHAERMLSELSDFLRYSIKDKDKLFIRLEEEILIAGKYLSMEKTRFEERLTYEIEVSEKARDVEILAFMLQPFVENAVKYGMRTSPEKLLIKIKGYAAHKCLYIFVENSGHWVENQDEGTGIRNVFQRLENAYPGRYNLDIKKGTDSVTVIIKICY